MDTRVPVLLNAVLFIYSFLHCFTGCTQTQDYSCKGNKDLELILQEAALKTAACCITAGVPLVSLPLYKA